MDNFKGRFWKKAFFELFVSKKCRRILMDTFKLDTFFDTNFLDAKNSSGFIEYKNAKTNKENFFFL